MTFVDQLQSLLLKANRFLDYRDFGIQLAQLKIIRRQFRTHQQPHIPQVRGGGLERRIGRLNASPHAPEQVDFIIQGEWDVEYVLRNCEGRDNRAIGGSVRRQPGPLSGEASVQFWIKTGSRHSGRSTRFGEAGHGGFERLILGHRALFILIEFAVVENFPPGIFRKRIERTGLMPWHGRLPILRHRDVRLLVVRSGERDGTRRREHDHDRAQALHAPPSLCTRTVCPSSIESLGFRTIESLPFNPPRISTSVPLSRPMMTGARCTLPSSLTTAARGPSARNSSVFTGTEIRGVVTFKSKCT